MIVQVASRNVEPSIWVATGFFSARYAIEKPATSRTTMTMPTSEIRIRKKYSASV